MGALAAMAQTGHAWTPPDAPGPGNADQGRLRLLQRHETGCILCHEIAGLTLGGNIGPALTGLARRYTAQALSARIADARQFNPQTIMPPYRSTTGLQHVAPAFQAKPILSAQALADIVSYLLADQVTNETATTPSAPPTGRPSPASPEPSHSHPPAPNVRP